MTKTEIKNFILNPSEDGLKALNAHIDSVSKNKNILKQIAISGESILRAKKDLEDIKTKYNDM